tara:strand:- start:1144 stop:1497 length:354 start_codon:yes stop_codon:yes gene_type:complete
MISRLKPPIELRNGHKDEKHRKKIIALPCIACKNAGLKQFYPTRGHHKMGHGGGKKSSDLLMIPLCVLHHDNEFIIRESDRHKLETWSIHYMGPKKWGEVWGTQDELIEQTNIKLNK